MKVNLEFLEKHDACKQGIGRFKEFDADELDILEAVKSSSDLTPEDAGFVFWCAVQVLESERAIRYACDFALVNIEKIKPYRSDEDYGLVVGFLNNPDECDADDISDVSYLCDLSYVIDVSDAAADAADAAIAAAYFIRFADDYAIDAASCALESCETNEEKAAVKNILIKALEEARNVN